nr:uncharacterized protein LOC127304613 [Lolium perenne]
MLWSLQERRRPPLVSVRLGHLWFPPSMVHKDELLFLHMICSATLLQAGAKHARHDLPDVADVRALVSIFKRLRPPPRMSSPPCSDHTSASLQRVCVAKPCESTTASIQATRRPSAPRQRRLVRLASRHACISVRVEQLGPYLTGSSSSPTAPRA